MCCACKIFSDRLGNLNVKTKVTRGKIMKMCVTCKQVLSWFNHDFRLESFWSAVEDPVFLSFQMNRLCKSNFLDSDNKVKTCLQFYAEKLTQYINQPERSKREDSQKCEMRCSEHCGNTMREVQKASSPKEI